MVQPLQKLSAARRAHVAVSRFSNLPILPANVSYEGLSEIARASSLSFSQHMPWVENCVGLLRLQQATFHNNLLDGLVRP